MPFDRRFPAMGGRCRIWLADGSDELADRLVTRVDELEKRWSRFIPESDTCRMNDAAGEPVVVDGDTIDLVRHSVAAAAKTGGRFDPTMGREIVAAGYHLPFDQVVQLPASISPAISTLRTMASPRARGERPTVILVDRDASTVTVPAGAAFDPGGLGKGRAADLVAEYALFCGASGAFVDIGGDIRMAGEPPSGTWPLYVDDPAGGPPLAMLRLPSSGVATTSTLKRRWSTEFGPQHHVLDPTTGRPSTSDLMSFTVIATETWWAEAISTAGVVGGREAAQELLAESGSTGMWMNADGSVGHAPGIERYLAG